MKIALLSASALYCVADVVSDLAPQIGPWAQLGAVGILGWVASALLGELRAARADSAKQREEQAANLERMLGRWDAWEDRRHEDAAALQDTLRKITANCAASAAETADWRKKGGPS